MCKTLCLISISYNSWVLNLKWKIPYLNEIFPTSTFHSHHIVEYLCQLLWLESAVIQYCVASVINELFSLWQLLHICRKFFIFGAKLKRNIYIKVTNLTSSKSNLTTQQKQQALGTHLKNYCSRCIKLYSTIEFATLSSKNCLKFKYNPLIKL